MQNIKVKTEGSKLILEIDLANKGQLSKSKKNILIASTQGNTSYVAGNVACKIGINVYKPNPDYTPE